MSHIQRQILEKLYRGELPLDEQLDILEHIGSCDYCANLFAEIAEDNTLISAPANLKSSILKETEQLPIQLQAKQHILSKRLQLMLYSIKIGAAAACAIVMLFMVNNDVIQMVQKSNVNQATKISNATNSFTQSINQITEKIMNREVQHND